MSRRVLALVEGEPHLAAAATAIQKLNNTSDFEVVGAVIIGTDDEPASADELDQLNVPTIWSSSPIEGVRKGLENLSPDVVFDLCDEPTVCCAERMNVACEILSLGTAYEGPDFSFSPAIPHTVCKKPSIAVIGTGGGVGKTAISSYMARVLSGQEGQYDEEWAPCIITMERGGPAEPEVIRGDELQVTPSYLLDMSDKGFDASSDHFENSLTAKVPTVGTRRCGGGLFGRVFESTAVKGVEAANDLPVDLLLLEAGGASIPDVTTDQTVVVVGANQPLERLTGLMGRCRTGRADLAVITLCEPPSADMAKVELVDKAIRDGNPSIKVVWTVFRPRPLTSIEDKKVIALTTAAREARETIVQHLCAVHGCEMLTMMHSLSNRARLKRDLAAAIREFPEADVLLTELKAASVEIATKVGLENGLEVVFMDNSPESVGGDSSLDNLAIECAQNAKQKFTKR